MRDRGVARHSARHHRPVGGKPSMGASIVDETRDLDRRPDLIERLAEGPGLLIRAPGLRLVLAEELGRLGRTLRKPGFLKDRRDLGV
jgi:hypothetical protein